MIPFGWSARMVNSALKEFGLCVRACGLTVIAIEVTAAIITNIPINLCRIEFRRASLIMCRRPMRVSIEGRSRTLEVLRHPALCFLFYAVSRCFDSVPRSDDDQPEREGHYTQSGTDLQSVLAAINKGTF